MLESARKLAMNIICWRSPPAAARSLAVASMQNLSPEISGVVLTDPQWSLPLVCRGLLVNFEGLSELDWSCRPALSRRVPDEIHGVYIVDAIGWAWRRAPRFKPSGRILCIGVDGTDGPLCEIHSLQWTLG